MRLGAMAIEEAIITRARLFVLLLDQLAARMARYVLASLSHSWIQDVQDKVETLKEFGNIVAITEHANFAIAKLSAND